MGRIIDVQDSQKWNETSAKKKKKVESSSEMIEKTCYLVLADFLIYVDGYMGFKRRWDGFSLTWYRGNGSNPPIKSKLSSSSVMALTT